MNAPKVSICIPAYKQVECLSRTLSSIQMQSFGDFEVVITDDSPDDSVKKAVETFDFQGKLKYFKNPKNLGSPENWNEAVKNSIGEYIKVMHHDDWFKDESSLEKFVRLLDDNPKADFGASSLLVWTSSPEDRYVHKVLTHQLENLSRDPRCLFFVNFIGSPSVTIYRRTVEVKYDPKLKWLVDIDFYIHVLYNNCNFALCEEPLVCGSDGFEHQVSRDCERNREVQLFEHLEIFRKIQSLQPPLELPEYRAFFKDLFARWNVDNYDEIKELGIEFPQLEGWFKYVILMSKLRVLKESVISSLNRFFRNQRGNC